MTQRTASEPITASGTRSWPTMCGTRKMESVAADKHGAEPAFVIGMERKHHK